MIFFERKVEQSLDVDGGPSLLQFTITIFMFLASTVMTQRGSKTVLGNMSKLLTVKTGNNIFFVLLKVVVFTKNIYPFH